MNKNQSESKVFTRRFLSIVASFERMITARFISAAHSTQNGRVLIVGAQNTGKTCLAFRIAYEEAEKGGCPLFICNQAKIETKLPLDVRYETDDGEQFRMSPDILSRIHMKYVTSMNELKAVLSGMHCFAPAPSTLIIDDLSFLIDPLHSVPRNDPKFLDICLSIGSFTDDVLNFMASKAISSSSNNTAQSNTLQLVITDSCDEAGFIHILQKTTHFATKLVKVNNSECYSLVTVGDARKVRGADRGVLLSRIEHTQGALFVRGTI